MGLVKREAKYELEYGNVWLLLDDGDGTDSKDDGYFVEVVDEEATLMSFRIPYGVSDIRNDFFDYMEGNLSDVFSRYEEHGLDKMFMSEIEYECELYRMIGEYLCS